VTLPRCCGGAIGGLSILRCAGVVCGVETQFPSGFSLVALLIDFAPASSSSKIKFVDVGIIDSSIVSWEEDSGLKSLQSYVKSCTTRIVGTIV